MPDKEEKQFSRREFVTGVGGLGAGALFGGLFLKGIMMPDKVLAIPASEGYILVDTKKCGGCETCMLTCSMVHEGVSNTALSRIQIVKNPFGKFPNDFEQIQCRQCPYPACVDACPTGALHADAASGNVRLVDAGKCIGCERCVAACPFTPSRAMWNFEKKHAIKCDLCANTPYWNKKGGPGGAQACVEMCPLHAISFTKATPVQSGNNGYIVDLRNQHWAMLNYPTAQNPNGPAPKPVAAGAKE